MLGYIDALVPAFGLLVLGWLLRRHLLPDVAVWAGIERLVFWVLTPCLLVSAIAPLKLAELPLGAMATVIWAALGLGVMLSLGLARACRTGHPAMTSVLMGGIRFNQLILRSQLHIFGQCGHWTQIERRERFIELVTPFLKAGG